MATKKREVLIVSQASIARAAIRFAEILERVDTRAMAADGPVTPTLEEITQYELRELYVQADLIRKEARGKMPRKVAGAAGIEPATTGLEGRCSIQLSYAPGGVTTLPEASDSTKEAACSHPHLDGIDAEAGANKVWRCTMCAGLFLCVAVDGTPYSADVAVAGVTCIACLKDVHAECLGNGCTCDHTRNFRAEAFAAVQPGIDAVNRLHAERSACVQGLENCVDCKPRILDADDREVPHA